MRWLVAAALLLGLPAAQAAPAAMDLHASGAAVLRGAWEADLGLLGLQALDGLAGTQQEGRLTILEAHSVGTGDLDGAARQAVVRLDVAGDVSFAGAGQLWLLPANATGLLPARAGGDGETRLAPGSFDVADFGFSDGGRDYLPLAGGLELARAVAGVDGPSAAVAFGPTVTVGTRQEWTGCRPAPTLPPEAGVQACRYALYLGRAGHWDLRGLDTLARVRTAAGHLAGALSLDHVEAAEWNGTPLPPGSVLVEPHGDFAFAFQASDGAAAWQVRGTLTGLKVDAAAVPVPSAAPVLVAAGAGLLAWVLRPWLVALYARVCALGGKTRRRILDELAARGGASAGELARALALHKTSVAYHLGVLARSGLAARVRVGNRHHFVARAPGGPPPLGAALAENPVRRAILHALAGGPLATPELVAAVRARAELGPGLSLFHYHAGILRGHGLVQVARSGRSFLWSLAPSPAALVTAPGGASVAG